MRETELDVYVAPVLAPVGGFAEKTQGVDPFGWPEGDWSWYLFEGNNG